ncbi:hypothetical protein AURDEDRAFT_117834 [Auricularia subglabra TFB-10046 SS5]|uniref:Uncharacterized protein n=1 Tax=Auricularia subglabra (strain TFB-10046 / SS5) TaxID=717982 RepID=J0LB60_AURST|nr:hypothetical protein AURDEDRAFT_117834 [Auricularia subglabra TFB-10046 SS5]
MPPSCLCALGHACRPRLSPCLCQRSQQTGPLFLRPRRRPRSIPAASNSNNAMEAGAAATALCAALDTKKPRVEAALPKSNSPATSERASQSRRRLLRRNTRCGQCPQPPPVDNLPVYSCFLQHGARKKQLAC